METSLTKLFPYICYRVIAELMEVTVYPVHPATLDKPSW